MKLSRREAFLLFVMGLVAIVGLMIAFVIIPLNNKIDANKIVLSGLESRKAVIDATLPLEPILRVRREETLKLVSDELNKIETPINAAQFDRWMLPLLTMEDIVVLSAEFTQSSVATPDSTVSYLYDPLYKIRTLILEYNKESSSQSDIPQTSSQIMLATYTYRFETDYEKFNFITSQITSWDTTVYIKEASFDFDSEEALLVIDVYTVHKLLPEENPKDYSGDFIPGRDSLVIE